MPTATVTIRDLKNKETGLDLSVTNHRVEPGLLTSTVEYQILVVSNLQAFKSPRHKQSDVVQYSIDKQLNDFEDFRNKLSAKFPGTLLPPVPKRSLMGSDSAITEKRKSLDHFIGLIAKTPKLSDCDVTLQFLGVNPKLADKSKHGSQDPVKEEERKVDLFDKEAEDTKQMSSSLFAEEDEEELDPLFGPSQKKQLFTELTDEDYELFSSKRSRQLFDSQDYGGAIDKSQADQFLPPGGSDIMLDSTPSIEVEDNTELLTIDDNFEDLFKKKTKEDEQSSAEAIPPKSTNADTPKEKPTVPENKPSVPGNKPTLPRNKPTLPPNKPNVAQKKPALPVKPLTNKPVVPTKPAVQSEEISSVIKSDGNVHRETIVRKPDLIPKDECDAASVAKGDVSETESAEKELPSSNLGNLPDLTNLDIGGIMSYIEENKTETDAQLF